METPMNTDCKTPEMAVQRALFPQPGPAVMLPLDAVVYDSALQMREQIDADHVESLCDAIDAGETLPPIEVFDDDEITPEITARYLIGDGNHRYLAAQKRGLKEIACRVFPGGRPAAQKRALGANAEHNALRRTNADKRKSVICALALFPKASLRELADICHVTHPFVLKIKKDVVTVTTPKTGKAGHVSDPRQTDWFESFLSDTYQPYETRFKDILNAKCWMDPEIGGEDKLKLCKQLEDGLRLQIREIERRKEQVQQELAAQKSAPALPEAKE